MPVSRIFGNYSRGVQFGLTDYVFVTARSLRFYPQAAGDFRQQAGGGGLSLRYFEDSVPCEQGFSPATIGLFYANLDDPMQGGTDHTIRVCQHYNVPEVLQTDWLHWADEQYE